MKAEIAEITKFLRRLEIECGFIFPEVQMLGDGSGSFVQGLGDEVITISTDSPFRLTHGKYLEFSDLDGLIDIIKNQDAIIAGGLE